MGIEVIGVPSAAGAFGGGVARAPASLRAAGLLEGLRRAGVDVVDGGDLPVAPFRSDPRDPAQQNLDRVVDVAVAVADRVRVLRDAWAVPLLLGGDCTITIGLLAGLIDRFPDLALAYLDGDADLSTPRTSVSGILDAMGLAHILGIDGAAPALAGIGGRVPLMAGHNVALIGYDESELDDARQQVLETSQVVCAPAVHARGRVRAAVDTALTALGERDGLVVHFDVDVIDSTDLPLAQYPHFNQGLSFDDAMAAFEELCSAPDLVAVVITETNPDNDPDGRYVRSFGKDLA